MIGFKQFLNNTESKIDSDTMSEAVLNEIRTALTEASGGRLIDIEYQINIIRHKTILKHKDSVLNFIHNSSGMIQKLMNYVKQKKVDIHNIAELYVKSHNFRTKLCSKFDFLAELEKALEVIRKQLNSGDLIHNI